MYKTCSEQKQMQQVTGFTEYSPIWWNDTNSEISKLQYVWKLQVYGVTLLKHIFNGGNLVPFQWLQTRVGLPYHMYLYYLQLQHAVEAQGHPTAWHLSPTPLFNLMQCTNATKRLMFRCYTVLLNSYLEGLPCKAMELLEADVGSMLEDQRETALVCSSCLNISQRLSHLYIVLRTHYTPTKLHKLGLVRDAISSKCRRDHGNLIHALWCCSKLHRYWTKVVDTINRAFRLQLKWNQNNAY